MSCTKNDDEFKTIYKYFKQRKNSPNLSEVLDLSLSTDEGTNVVRVPQTLSPHSRELCDVLRVRYPDEWKVVTLDKHPGLFYVQNPFTTEGSVHWSNRCLTDFTSMPYRTNLSQLGQSYDVDWWKGHDSMLIKNMRWSTMGYHHNWDTKEYSSNEVSPMPEHLSELCNLILGACGLRSNFEPQAAIVNFYPKGACLGPHTDHSEPLKDAPLISFSFGPSGIFLLGGTSKLTKPTAMFLHHGDVLIMSGSSRLCYHALPAVVSTPEWDKQLNDILWSIESHSGVGHVKSDDSLPIDNGNVILKSDNNGNEVNCNDVKESPLNSEESANGCKSSDGIKNSVSRGSFENIESATEDVLTCHYLKNTRINLNIRQVFGS